jgi:rod shape-determining protein MreD
MPPVWTLVSHLAGLAVAAALMWLAIAIDLAPLTGAARGWAMPDLLFLVTACLALRRPGMVPAPLVLVAGLLRDLLAGGAVGPGALALLVASRFLRGRAPALKRRSLLVEWLDVTAMAVLTVVLPALLLWVTLADVPSAASLGLRLLATVLAYPLVVAVLRVGRARALRTDDIGDEARA